MGMSFVQVEKQKCYCIFFVIFLSCEDMYDIKMQAKAAGFTLELQL